MPNEAEIAGVNGDDIHNAMNDIFEALMSVSRKKIHLAYAEWKDDPKMIRFLENLNALEFSGMSLYMDELPSNAVDGAIDLYLSGILVGREHEKSAPESYIRYSDFFLGHLTELFQRCEGYACSADKARYILRGAINLHLKSRPISFQGRAGFDYYIPKKILTTQEDVLKYLDSLRFLYHGKPRKYFEYMCEIEKQMQPGEETKTIVYET